MNINDIIEIDLPVILVMIILWVLDYLNIRKIERAMEEMRTRGQSR